VIFVEVLDRHGEVARRVRVDAFPFRLGRSYASDLIVDDPYVHALQAAIEQDETGRVAWRDLGPDATAPREIPPGGELVVLTGQTQIRLRDGAFEVAPALPLVPRGGFTGWVLSHWTSVPVLLAAVTAAQVLIGIANTWGKIEPAAFARQVVIEIGIVLVWAGAWAFAGRVLTHRARFVAHVAVTCAWSLAVAFTDEAYQWAQFLVPNIEPLQTGERIFRMSLGVALVFAQLSILHVARVRTRALVAAGIGVAGLAGTLVLDRNPERWISEIPFWSRIQPIDPRWLPRQSADQFFASVTDLEAPLAEDAKEKPHAEGGDEDDDEGGP
jgi:hypothetical protein